VFLASDVKTKAQLACKVVDLRKVSVTQASRDTLPDATLLERAAEYIRLLREMELLSKLDHVGARKAIVGT
jgi:hypothetical protein